MTIDATLIRLIVSQAFALSLLLILVPLKPPQKINAIRITGAALIITAFNALLIVNVGITFYIRFYLITLTLPYVIVFFIFCIYKGSRLIFALLTVQMIGNIAIINGLFISYILHGENTPLADTAARVGTYFVFLPVVYKFIRPTYLKMVDIIHKGWWVLNTVLILSYALAYYTLFIPDTIFNRPEYFIHAYIAIALTFFIYIVIFFLFLEVQSKIQVERDKEALFTRVTSLAAESAAITTIAYKDSLTGIKNRYALFIKLKELIQAQHPFYILFLDLNNLKTINDTYSHSVGDAYIKQFTGALIEGINDSGEVYRFAGDEFVCIMDGDEQQFNHRDFKRSIAEKMKGEIRYYGVCIGLASYPIDALNADDLIHKADQAMYKEKKKSQYHR